MAARQDRALDAWRQLHWVMLMEDLRQGRNRDVGDAADRLPTHTARSAEPRAPRLFSRSQLQLVPLFRQPGEISAGALAPHQALARGTQPAHSGGRLGLNRGGPEKTRGLYE